MDETFDLNFFQEFPWRGRFETKTEIDDYFAGDKVRCLLCGKQFKALSSHLGRVHDVTVDDYREQYGLPWQRGLCGAGTTEKMSKNMLNRRNNGFCPPIEAAQKASIKAANRRPDQPFLVNPDGHLKIPHLWPGQNPPPEVSTHPQRQGKMSLQILD
jgi:hypothetical protein